jgi:hypothetical protein
MVNQKSIRLIIFGLFGAIFGFLFSCVYLIIYYGTSYNQPVADSIRSNNAFQVTILVFLLIAFVFYGVYHRKTIIEMFVTDKDNHLE